MEREVLPEGSIMDNSDFCKSAVPPGGKARKTWFLELLKISRENKMSVVNAGWWERGREGEKFLSSLARQRNMAQLFLSYFILVSSLRKKKKRKRLKNLSGRYKGKKLWPFSRSLFECHAYCCIPRASISEY